MDKKRILVFPSGSEIGLEIHRSLRWAKEVDLWGASSVADHGQFVFGQHIDHVPYVTDPDFVSHVNQLVCTYAIDYIFPAHDSVMVKLAEAFQARQLACRVLTSPYETCKVARSKRLTMELFRQELVTPRVFDDVKQITGWPVFLKPDVGQGSKGTALAHCELDVRTALERDPSLLILEHLPGDEYTVDCFTNRHGELLFAAGRRRTRIMNGISVHTVPFEHEDIQRLASLINQRLKFRGVWFFQLKRNQQDQLALMEIAPRVAGGMALYRNLGVNFALLSLYDAEGFDVQAVANGFSIELDRALYNVFKVDLEYSDVYVDLDDCLILHGQLNAQLIAFLYQCVAQGKRLHLLSRHDGDLTATLTRYRIQGLFDSVEHLNREGSKADYIQTTSAVFIDDSFAERQDVHRRWGIPVFAPDAVESLLDWSVPGRPLDGSPSTSTVSAREPGTT